MILLSLYMVSEEMICKLGLETGGLVTGKKDLISDYMALSKDLMVQLDPSLRVKLVKKGLSIIENIYTGFDTEYKNIGSIENKLISVQLSVCSKILLKIKLVEDFNFVNLDIQTGKVQGQSDTSSKQIN